jgi:uncharacterized protein
MYKVLFFVGIAFLIYLGFVLNKRKAELARKQQAVQKKQSASHVMVECAHCGLFLPKSDALQKDGEYYCCPEHELLGKK